MSTNNSIVYDTFEKVRILRPVDRLDFISNLCIGKNVLDVGCLDETALVKLDTQHWLHGRIARVARQVVGIDSSSSIPEGVGVATSESSRIFRGDAINIDISGLEISPVHIVVAGEFIEHLENPLSFLKGIKQKLPGVEFVLSTPNGCSFSNFMMGLIGRESQHPDHLCNFTYKTLNTLCLRAGIAEWEIRPYAFCATEMKMKSSGARRLMAVMAERVFRLVEICFPLISCGYIVRGKL